MKKRNPYITGSIIVLIVIVLVVFLFQRQLTWENMQIRDFKIHSFKDSWENYPFPAKDIDLNLIELLIPEIKGNIDEIKFYEWKSGGKTYAFIYAVKLKEKLLEGGSSIPIAKENILGEEVYFNEIPVSYEGTKEDLRLYIFDEQRFIFVVGGMWSFPEALVKKLIEKYPENPTKSKIDILTINKDSSSLTKSLFNFL